jgi:hypothetical protein
LEKDPPPSWKQWARGRRGKRKADQCWKEENSLSWVPRRREAHFRHLWVQGLLLLEHVASLRRCEALFPSVSGVGWRPHGVSVGRHWGCEGFFPSPQCCVGRHWGARYFSVAPVWGCAPGKPTGAVARRAARARKFGEIRSLITSQIDKFLLVFTSSQHFTSLRRAPTSSLVVWRVTTTRTAALELTRGARSYFVTAVFPRRSVTLVPTRGARS